MFESKSRAYSSGIPERCLLNFEGKPLALPTNIRLAWKQSANNENTVAYSASSSVMQKKKFDKEAK